MEGIGHRHKSVCVTVQEETITRRPPVIPLKELKASTAEMVTVYKATVACLLHESKFYGRVLMLNLY